MVPSQAPLYIVSGLSALFGLALIGWLATVRRAARLAAENIELKNDLVEVTKALENEMKWRLASETYSTKVATNVGESTAKTARDLQQLLASDDFGTFARSTGERAAQREAPNTR
jgi:hypothetical protein